MVSKITISAALIISRGISHISGVSTDSIDVRTFLTHSAENVARFEVVTLVMMSAPSTHS